MGIVFVHLDDDVYDDEDVYDDVDNVENDDNLSLIIAIACIFVIIFCCGCMDILYCYLSKIKERDCQPEGYICIQICNQV